MEKRGATNIEFIMAFVLFAGSLTVIFYFFNPVSDVRSMESSKDYVMNTIITNTSVEVDSYSIILEGSSVGVNIPGTSGMNAKVVDYYDRPLDSEKHGSSVCFSCTEKLAVIYFSEDIDGAPGSCTETAGEYQIASSSNNSIISEKRILGLKDNYEDYSSLKEQMGIPASMDFSFTLEFSADDSIIAAQDETGRGEVFSETVLKEVLRKDGTSQFGYLTVSVW